MQLLKKTTTKNTFITVTGRFVYTSAHKATLDKCTPPPPYKIIVTALLLGRKKKLLSIPQCASIEPLLSPSFGNCMFDPFSTKAFVQPVLVLFNFIPQPKVYTHTRTLTSTVTGTHTHAHAHAHTHFHKAQLKFFLFQQTFSQI